MEEIEFKLDKFTPLWSYYDWAITGANCIAYLCSTEQTVKRQLKNVPVIAVGYEINQSKTPAYGYADTGPRTILRGQRVVSGQLLIAHTEVGYLEKVLRDAGRSLYNTTDKLSLNEELRLKYWNTRHWENTFKDPQRKDFAKEEDKYNLFYAHPNFDISIVYGVGDDVGKLAANKDGHLNLSRILGFTSEWHSSDNDKGYQDVNPLYRPPASNKVPSLEKQRETISGIQLVGKGKSIAADGDIIVESYSFLAIDVLNQ